MSPHQIIAVAVRLIALWLAVTTILGVPVVYVELQQLEFDASTKLIILLGTNILALLLVYFLWKFPLTVAAKLLASPSEGKAESATPDLWLNMGCSLIGLFLLTLHVPTLVQNLVLFEYSKLDPSITMTFAYNVTGIIMALWLVFGAIGFRRLFWWARSAGRS